MSSKFSNVLQPSFGINVLPSPQDVQQKLADSPLQRSTVRKSFKRRLPQNLPVRDTAIAIVPQQPPLAESPKTKVGTKNSLGPDPPASVARRNARERNRVKQVNTGFAVLRQHIPVLIGSAIVYGGSPNCDSSSSSSSPPSSAGSNGKKNKMSKVETLRCAVEYIRNLEKLLATGGDPSAPAEDTFYHVKEEPFELMDAIASSENISPGNDLSAFYDSSSSSGSPDRQGFFSFDHLSPTGKRMKESSSASPESFKQELLRSLSSWNGNGQPVDLMLDGNQPAMSDNSLLESINNWWCPNL